MREHWRDRSWRTAAIGLALVTWEAAARFGWLNTTLVPAPTQVIQALCDMTAGGKVWKPILESLQLVLTGFTVATIVGVSIGVAMGVSRPLYNLLEPLVELIRPVPKPALIPPLFLFFGIGWTSMVIIVTVAAVFPILTNTLSGVRGIDAVLLDTARTFRTAHAVRRVVLPAALPSIFTGMKVSIGIAVVLASIAEVLAGDTGIGTRLVTAQREFVADQMYAWIVLLSAMSVLLVTLLDALQKWIVPWRGKD